MRAGIAVLQSPHLGKSHLPCGVSDTISNEYRAGLAANVPFSQGLCKPTEHAERVRMIVANDDPGPGRLVVVHSTRTGGDPRESTRIAGIAQRVESPILRSGRTGRESRRTLWFGLTETFSPEMDYCVDGVEEPLAPIF